MVTSDDFAKALSRLVGDAEDAGWHLRRSWRVDRMAKSMRLRVEE